MSRLTIGERFWGKVQFTPGCWLWNGARLWNGYGQISFGGRDHQKAFKAHRVAYEMARGPIPAGLDLDHLCRVRHCVNPYHLEPVTRGENLRRSPLVGMVGRHYLMTLTPEQRIARSRHASQIRWHGKAEAA